MIRKLQPVVFGLALGVSSMHALDSEKLESSLDKFSSRVESTLKDYNRSGALDKSDNVERLLGKDGSDKKSISNIVNTINTNDGIEKAKKLVEKFSSGNSSKKYAADVLSRMLKRRALYIQMNAEGEAKASIDLDSLTPSIENQQFLRPEEFIATDVPVFEGVINVTEKGGGERVRHAQSILDRHECDVNSSYTSTKGDDSHNFYFSCKAFVTKALVDAYGGEVTNRFEVELELRTGGWLFRKTQNVSLKPEGQNKDTFTLGWTRAMIEPNPFEYLHKKGGFDFSKLAKVKEIAGEKTTILKNARYKMWVKAPGADNTQAIYYQEQKLGTLNLRGGQ